MSIFAIVGFLIKQFQIVFILDCNIWNKIAIIIVLDSLYNNFKVTTTSILECKNKTIKEIPQILAFTKVKLVSK